MTDKIELRNVNLNPDYWNSRLMLVEYKERVSASRVKWAEQGLDFLQEASKPINYAEVANWFRLTLDLRLVNAATIPEPFPMPSTTIAKEHCKDSRFFCVSDLADAFFSVKLRPEDYGKTGFTTHDSQFVFKVMPQGAMNAARQFSRIATAAFEGVPLSVICPFQDDTLNHAKTFFTSLENQQLLYDCARKSNLILKVSKTTLGYPTAKFLGHIHSQHGRSPDPALISAVLDIATPTEVSHVRHLLGLIQYNMEYIRGGMGIISCLSDLTLKGVNIKEAWDPKTHGVAFEEIKYALTHAPCLIPIDPRGKFTIHVDTCKTERGIGAVLLQWVEKLQSWRPCAYYSRKLIKGQKQWSATELEAMGMVFACIHWDKFLRNGLTFRIVVDHKALLWLVTRKTKTANGRIISWILQLQDYDFEILHRNGTDHLDADAISRLLHFEDIKGAYEMAEDLDIDDLNGPATGQDLKHLIQLFHLQKFMKERSVNLLHKEVALPPTEPKEITLINLNSVQTTQHTKDYSLAHTDLLNTVLQTNPQMLTEDEDDFLSHIYSYLDALQETTESEDQSELYIEEETELDLLTGNEIANSLRTFHTFINSMETTDQPNTNHAINIPQSNSHAKTLKQSPYTQMLKEAQSSFKVRRDSALALDKAHNNKIRTKEDRTNDDLIDELITPYRYLEGQCFIDPRNRRMYEVIMVTYHEDLQVIAAFRQTTDNEPPDLTDNELVLVEGPDGLAALVKAFSATGGNQGQINVPWPTSSALMRTAQLQDPKYAELLEKTGTLNPVKEGNNVYITNSPTSPLLRLKTKGNRHFKQIVVPSHLRIHIMQFFHDCVGHPGAGRMMDTLSTKYWWSGYQQDTQDYVNQCKFCLRRKPSSGGVVPIQEYLGPDYPFQRTHMDLTGPFPETKAGNKYILVVKCALTRYAEVTPITDKEARTVAHALVKEVYLRHGSMETLISDMGTEFTNKTMRMVATILKTKLVCTTPANPRSNGLAENHMRTMKDSLASFCNARQDDWDLWLGTVGFGYVTTVNQATGYTPFYMLYGREASVPSQEWVLEMAKLTSVDQYIADLITCLQHVWTTVGDLKPKQTETMNQKKLPLKHNIQVEYVPGALCYLKRVPKRNYIDWKEKLKYKISSKLQTRYTGPYRILRQLSPVLYVANVDGHEKTIHAINMKRTPDVRTISQANVDAARRIDSNRIHGTRTGGAEDRVPAPLLVSEEARRRNIIADMETAGKQSSEEKTTNRTSRFETFNLRRQEQRKNMVNKTRAAKALKAILSPVPNPTVTIQKQHVVPLLPTSIITPIQLAPPPLKLHSQLYKTRNKKTKISPTAPSSTVPLVNNNTAGHQEKEGIRLTKTPSISTVQPQQKDHDLALGPQTRGRHNRK